MHSLWDSLGKLLIDFSQHMLLIFIGLRLGNYFFSGIVSCNHKNSPLILWISPKFMMCLSQYEHRLSQNSQGYGVGVTGECTALIKWNPSHHTIPVCSTSPGCLREMSWPQWRLKTSPNPPTFWVSFPPKGHPVILHSQQCPLCPHPAPWQSQGKPGNDSQRGTEHGII